MERNLLVDRLKGYACFLVLFGHVIMGVRLAGIDIPSFFWDSEKVIWSFHVALFLFLSGTVYRMTGEWRGKKTRLGFIAHKLLGLGIPYVVFSAVYILINSLVGQVNTQSSVWDILWIWKTPVAQYWFLYALFFLFCIWALLSRFLKNWMITLLTVAASYAVPLLGGSLGCFDIVFGSALAFGLGTCVNITTLTKVPLWGKILGVAAHIAAGFALAKLDLIEKPVLDECIMLLGILASIWLFSIIGAWKPLDRFLLFMNKYSFQTYLLHTIFTAGIRIVLLRVHINWWWVHVLVGTLFGIGCSVLASVIAKKMKFPNFFFFPTKYLSKK